MKIQRGWAVQYPKLIKEAISSVQISARACTKSQRHENQSHNLAYDHKLYISFISAGHLNRTWCFIIRYPWHGFHVVNEITSRQHDGAKESHYCGTTRSYAPHMNRHFCQLNHKAKNLMKKSFKINQKQMLKIFIVNDSRVSRGKLDYDQSDQK